LVEKTNTRKDEYTTKPDSLDPASVDSKLFKIGKKKCHYRDEWKEWSSSAADLVKDMNHLPYIVGFFKSFEADAYVISASTKAHRHPDSSTIFGLALAVKSRQFTKAKTLFMTSGFGIKYHKLYRMAKFLGVDLTELFDNFLKIRYLKEGSFYMTLSGMADLTGENRDLRNSTDPYDIRNVQDTYEARRKTYDQMEFVFKLGPVRDFADLNPDHLYNISTNGRRFFLDLSFGAPTISENPVDLKIKTIWHGGSDLKPDQIYIIKDNGDVKFRLGEGSKNGNTISWTLLWDEGKKSLGFYRDGTNKPKIEKPEDDNWCTAEAVGWIFTRCAPVKIKTESMEVGTEFLIESMKMSSIEEPLDVPQPLSTQLIV
jgi:hypothetical protein